MCIVPSICTPFFPQYEHKSSIGSMYLTCIEGVSVGATQGQRHHVDRIRSMVGKMKIRMWVGSEAELGELGAGFRWGAKQGSLLDEPGHRQSVGIKPPWIS